MATWQPSGPRKRSSICWRATGIARSRAEYCQQQGISASTLDYYLRRYDRKPTPRLARVKVKSQPAPVSFAVVLRNGRRIESAWEFRDADLARLIRVAEAE